VTGRPRLSPVTLAALPPDVIRPRYDRRAIKTGVVHLGIGAFHRAHQAVVFDQLLGDGDLRWGIVGASLRSPAVRDALTPQSGLYTLVERDGAGEQKRVIGAVKDVLVAPENPQGLIEAMAGLDVHLVTLTVTEKGYLLNPGNGALALDHPAVAADLANPEAPSTAIGIIAAALALRRTRSLPAFTAISCDNLSDNGARLGRAVVAFANVLDPALADWIGRHGAFPSTMVDRIVPATTAEDTAALATSLGVVDQAMVKTEPFLQWVIEDRFAGIRPAFEDARVQIVSSVAPWEAAKLRLLNGAHSAMAYLGGLAGLPFVHDFVSAPRRAAFINRLWDEAEGTLTPTDGLDFAAYRAALIARFANPALNHALRQIAADGSQKLPQRLVAPLAIRLERGLASPALTLAIAGWVKWQSGKDDAGNGFVVDDPVAHRTKRLLSGRNDAAARVDAILSLSEVFPEVVAANAGFREDLTRMLDGLDQFGAVEMLGRVRS